MKKAKIFKVSYAPFQDSEEIINNKIDILEAQGAEIASVDVMSSTAYILAKFDTVTQEHAQALVDSGAATIPAEAIEGKDAQAEMTAANEESAEAQAETETVQTTAEATKPSPSGKRGQRRSQG